MTDYKIEYRKRGFPRYRICARYNITIGAPRWYTMAHRLTLASAKRYIKALEDTQWRDAT